MKSQAKARFAAPPAAAPATAQMMIFDIFFMYSTISESFPARGAMDFFEKSGSSQWAFMYRMSPPAEKARPAPVRTMTFTALSASAASSASASSWAMVMSSAFSVGP